jgi:hypothetical protein
MEDCGPSDSLFLGLDTGPSSSLSRPNYSNPVLPGVCCLVAGGYKGGDQIDSQRLQGAVDQCPPQFKYLHAQAYS